MKRSEFFDGLKAYRRAQEIEARRQALRAKKAQERHAARAGNREQRAFLTELDAAGI